MAKVQFSDVLPPDKRSIRNISISRPNKRRNIEVVETSGSMDKVNISPQRNVYPATPTAPIPPTTREVPETKSNPAYEFYYPKKDNLSSGVGEGKRKTFIIGGLVIAACLIFVFSMMTVFSSATVLLNPKNQDLQVSLDFTASKDPIATSTVRYEVLKLTKSDSTSVEATGEEFVEEKASGKIVIYNNFSSEPQRLIIRTRFESAQGLIYRIPESIVVPGKTSQGPGSIEVTVFADEAGEKYNIEKTDFTVPGFKSDAERYKGFYARSATAMSGGFSGKRKTVAAADKSAALGLLDANLTEAVSKEFDSKVPEGLVLLKDSIVFDYRETAQNEDSSKVTIGREVDAYAILLNKDDLSKMISAKYLEGNPEWQNMPSLIKDFSGLRVSKKPNAVPSNGNINLGIEGSATIFAHVDVDAIVAKLSGIEKKNINALIESMPNVSSMKVTLRPIWKQSFPENPSKIEVKLE